MHREVLLHTTQRCTKSWGTALLAASLSVYFRSLDSLVVWVCCFCLTLEKCWREGLSYQVRRFARHLVWGGLNIRLLHCHFFPPFWFSKYPARRDTVGPWCGKFYRYILCPYSVDACTVDLYVQLHVCCEEVREHVCSLLYFSGFKFLALVREIWETLLTSCCLCV